MTKNKRLRRRKAARILSNLYAVLVYSVFYIPVAVMIVFSFNDAKRNYYWQGFTTEWYGKLFSFANTDLWDALLYSLIIAVLATLISVTIGVLGGIGLKKFEFRTKRFINMMIYVPIIVPEIVLAVAMLIIFMTVGIRLGMGTILIGHCTFCIPYAVVTIKGRITGDSETLQEASMGIWGPTGSRRSGGSRCPALCPVSFPPPSWRLPCPSTTWSCPICWPGRLSPLFRCSSCR